MNAAKIRPSVLAGSWYPDDPNQLRQSVEGYLALGKILLESRGKSDDRLRGLILPHAGHRYSGKTCAAGVAAACGNPPRRLLLIGPSHATFLRGAALSGASCFQTPLGSVPVDGDAVSRLTAAGIPVSDDPHAREHCLEILLPFFQAALKEFKIVPILVGRIIPEDRIRLRDAIRQILDDRTLLIASSDFTHYGDAFDYTPDVGSDVRSGVRKIDEEAIGHIKSRKADAFMDFQARTGATICGMYPIALLLDLISPESRVDLLDYSQSADVSGETDRMVSYAAIAIYEKFGTADSGTIRSNEKRLLLDLARSVIRKAALRQTLDDTAPPTRALAKKMAVFVTLTKSGNLRGCIGTLKADKPLWQAVQDAAWSAAVEDHRFTPVTPDELNEISVEVTVLSPLTEISAWTDFTPGRHGIVLEKDGRRAVFLPQVAVEMGWTREETLNALCKKAGLPLNAWQQPGMQFWIFTGEKFGATP